VSVLEEISTGEVLLAAAKRSLKLMQDFVTAQQELLKPGGVPTLLAAAAAAAAGPSGSGGSSTKLAAATAAAGAAAAAGSKAAGGAVELSFEMVAALLNNSVDCYNQSLEFTEHVQVGFSAHCHCVCLSHLCCCLRCLLQEVSLCALYLNVPRVSSAAVRQSLLDEGLSAQLDVEDTCRTCHVIAAADYAPIMRVSSERFYVLCFCCCAAVAAGRGLVSAAGCRGHLCTCALYTNNACVARFFFCCPAVSAG
jgi:hypothetical protein